MLQAIYRNVRWYKGISTTALAGVVVLLSASCKKVGREEMFPASLTIVNAVNDNTSFLNACFGESQPKIYAKLAYISNGAAGDYATNKMSLPVRLFRNYDTLHFDQPFLQTRLNLEPGGIFTHFVYGSSSKVQQKTVKENLPSRSLNDSVAHLRIINLFQDRPVDVVQLEPVAVTMASNLAYEQITDFIKVPVTTAVGNFRFQVKDHATGVIIATLTEVGTYPGSTTLNTQWLFKARTMLVTGTWTDAANYSAKASTIGHF